MDATRVMIRSKVIVPQNWEADLKHKSLDDYVKDKICDGCDKVRFL